jgi:hypothetical protein
MVLFLFSMGGVASLASARSETLAAVIASDPRFSGFDQVVKSADLVDLLNSPGPYTLFIPTNEALATLGGATLQSQGRQITLYHIVPGRHAGSALWGLTTVRTALGQNLTFSNAEGSVLINGSARIGQTDIAAANGVIHLIDAPLRSGNAQAGAGESAAPAAQQGGAPPPTTHGHLADPAQNPAWVGGGRLSYAAGVQTDSTHCKGMTWTVLQQWEGVTKVGTDRQTNPYRGDTGCQQTRPLLCIRQDFSQPPLPQYAQSWAHGRVQATNPIPGTALTSAAVANQLCANAFGEGWRMAEFHDGGMGRQAGRISGWDFQALGNLPIGQRFWVHINDQPANPWNSTNPRMGAPSVGTPHPIYHESENPAWVSSGTPQWQMRQIGRNGCQGHTWTVQRQQDGLVRAGADASSNPFHGDRGCNNSYPVLCIRVDGHAPPAPSSGNNYAHGWSGGWVQATHSVSGFEIDSREKANQLCANSFGSAWRMVNFHDGALGIGGTGGWSLWGYGNLPVGQRFWVAVNDQAANPWNR